MADELRQSKTDLQRKSQEQVAEVILPCVASGAESLHRARLAHYEIQPDCMVPLQILCTCS